MPLTLLSLPTEIRLQILYYALLPSVRPSSTSDPTLINIEFRNARSLARMRCRVYWGTSFMSALLRINRQLSRDAEDVLYKSFVFSWVPFPVSGMVDWVESLSSRARGLLRRIEFTVILSREDAEYPWRLQRLGVDKDASELKKLLPGLRAVRIRIAITAWPAKMMRLDKTETLGMRRLEDVIVKVAECFEGVEELGLNTVPASAYTETVVERCRKRIKLGYW